jgi:hypothetical protein
MYPRGFLAIKRRTALAPSVSCDGASSIGAARAFIFLCPRGILENAHGGIERAALEQGDR